MDCDGYKLVEHEVVEMEVIEYSDSDPRITWVMLKCPCCGREVEDTKEPIEW